MLPVTHEKNRVGTPDQIRKLLEADKPSKVAKTVRADFKAAASLNAACAALEASHGREAVVVFLSNLWRDAGDAGRYAVQKQLNSDWISEQLGKIG